MTITQWFIFFLLLQVIHFLGTWKLYQRAGRQAWEAAVPIYNAVVLTKIINRPWWYVLLLFVPIVNLIMFPVFWVETLRSFGKNKISDTLLGIITLGFYIYYVNYTQEVSYIPNRSLKNKSKSGEWVSAILFAVVVATIVHTYFIQPFTIPTPSLEKTLLVGDFLFVSKMHYGARTPKTAVALPMVHDTIPLIKKKSYLNKPQLPSFRFPAFETIENNDIVVFNWPTDTVPYFGYRGTDTYIKPIDKKSNYVKRAVAIPGDTLEIKAGTVYINHKELEQHSRQYNQFLHALELQDMNALNKIVADYGITEYGSGSIFSMNTEYWDNPSVIQYLSDPKNNLHVSLLQRDSSHVLFSGKLPANIFQSLGVQPVSNMVLANMTEQMAQKAQEDPRIKQVIRYTFGPQVDIFPHDNRWSQDNMGPLVLPKQGMTVSINIENIPLYQRLIEVYEGSEMGIDNQITLSGNQVLLNGQPLTQYTFLQDYYWMMGDNRHNSADSRMFGFVPANHIVGKPVFIWLSLDPTQSGFNKIRWDRMFTTVGGDGEPVSYFKHFLIALGLWFAFDYFYLRKRRGNKRQEND